MLVNEPEREGALAKLCDAVRDLDLRMIADRLDATEMILGCRRILDAWIAIGRASTDDPVVGFLGIESQTNHVLGGVSATVGRDVDQVRFKPGSPEEGAEVEDCGRWFLDAFKQNIVELKTYLEGSCPPATAGSD